MDLSKRLIAKNALLAVLLLAYFHLQRYDGCARIVSFIVAVPLMRSIDVLFRVDDDLGKKIEYSAKNVSRRVLYGYFGVFLALAIEMAYRVVLIGWRVGCLSILIMTTSMMCYFNANLTGVCYSNVKTYQQGTFSFLVVQWMLMIISFLFGSGWVAYP